MLAPSTTSLADLHGALKRQGFAVLSADALQAGVQAALAGLTPFWDDLPPDTHLKDGGRYRFRRHGSFVLTPQQVTAVPHRAHWQPVEYNALHGGIERWFEPLADAMVADNAFQALLKFLASVADALRSPQPWSAEVHPFRITTADGIGRPTPEGAHRDGVDLVAVLLVGRHHIKGGETRVFEADGPAGQRFTLTEPWSALLLDDARVIHESTPIQPLRPEGGWRDTLVITLRAGGFQGPRP
ncbi:MAG TPA: 2OG-Fe dioxygenase family protein [Burkholderiaceae bacterium]|nr:2OG-Fe dioxygenase family protein [Burkholderiaceae bacterium]